MSSLLQSIPSSLLSGIPVVLWSTDLDLRFTAVIAGEGFKERILMSPAVVPRDGYYGFDTRYVQHPDVISHLRARAGESVEWETEWGGRAKARVIPLLNPRAECVGMLGAAVDQSRLDAAEKRRIGAESILFTLLEKGNCGTAVLNLDDGAVFADKVYAKTCAATGDAVPIGRGAPGEMRQALPACQGECLTQPAGEAGKSPGEQLAPEAVQDADLLNGFPKPVALIGVDGILEGMNAEFARITAIDDGMGATRHVSTVFADLKRDALERIYEETAGTEKGAGHADRNLDFRDNSQRICRANVAFSRTSPSSPLIMMTITDWADLPSWADSRSITTRLPLADRKILELLAAGASNAQIADELHLSRQGLDYRLKSLRGRLHANTRGALVGKAFAEGLFAAGVWPPRTVD
jgi:DNA-binding CsgD family transcriptional regulator